MNTRECNEIHSVCGLLTDADERMLASCKTSAADHNQEVVPIPDGMQAFLESIDTCFADPSFWSGL